MKKIVLLSLLAFFNAHLPAQNFKGQWKGEFIDKSTSFTGWGGDRCEYVLEIETNGSKVSGYSYTYFSDGGKRYYTICKLSGTINRSTKYIEVKEIERTKTNVPVNIRNCFQIHKLTYFAQGNEQKLEGIWIPVPNQEGDCGYGTTVLTRRVLQKNPTYYNNPVTKTKPVIKPKTTESTTKKTSTTPPVAKTQPKKNTPPPLVKKESTKIAETPVVRTDPGKNVAPFITSNVPPPNNEVKKIADPHYEKRNTDILKTIEIDNPAFTVDLYDNGEIDGDSISLFFNGKLILSQKRLTDKAIRLTLQVDQGRDLNELIMYAENLGTIPPNTALMVVNDGDNRYEVRISSDLQKSGVIRFIHKAKSRQ